MIPAILALALAVAEPPRKAELMPAVELVAKDGKVEARWKTPYASFSATAPKVTAEGSRIILTGTADDPVVMSVSHPDGADTQTGRVIEISLTGDTYKVIGSGGGTLRRK